MIDLAINIIWALVLVLTIIEVLDMVRHILRVKFPLQKSEATVLQEKIDALEEKLNTILVAKSMDYDSN